MVALTHFPPGAVGYGKSLTSVYLDALDNSCLEKVGRLVDLKAGAAPTIALDLGGAQGTVSVEMAKRGAEVIFVDLIDKPGAIEDEQLDPAIRSRITAYPKTNVKDLSSHHMEGRKADVVYSQRCLHFLTFAEQAALLRNIKEHYATKNCVFFISLASTECDLGIGYKGAHHPINAPERHTIPTSPQAAEAHITQPMTLYKNEEEIQQLMKAAGLKATSIIKSESGVYKIVAESYRAIGRSALALTGPTPQTAHYESPSCHR